ncbi:MAG: VrrA/YqfQ family protein [Mycoplasmatota bacterium]
MNYNLPSLGLSATGSKGILGLFGKNGITLSSIIGGTQKTLNFMNQAIPVVKQVSPMMKNVKTMFQVMNEFKKTDTPSTKTSNNTQTNKETNIKTNIEQNIKTKKESFGPTFFID